MTHLLLIRHGVTDWNREGRFMGRTDLPLNLEGLAQAETAAASLRGQKLEAVYTSDLQRARQTAEIVARAVGAPVFPDARLREIDQGEWEGELFSVIRETYADLLARRRREPLDTHAPGGESVRQIQARILPLLDEIAQRHPRGRVAIVSHGVTLAVMKVHLLRLAVETVWDQVPDHLAIEELFLEAG
jgi:broad specificity phosphatase PhoE